jgi:hypothetical protein
MTIKRPASPYSGSNSAGFKDKRGNTRRMPAKGSIATFAHFVMSASTPSATVETTFQNRRFVPQKQTWANASLNHLVGAHQ